MERLSKLQSHFATPMWTMKTFVPYDFESVGDLKGKTVLITGASRGIGLEIGKRCARDGANIVIIAKTTEPHPKLPGTIYTAAKEIEAAGGKCLPIACDIRDEQAVKNAIDQAVKHFGGLDILINNASAVQNASVEEMEVKRFDLIQSINSRGTLVCSKYAIPHLRKSKNPHILTISPPLYMGTGHINWFAKLGTGYTLGKYAMTLITHGLAGELQDDGIACNTLWPRTAIKTAAIQNVLGGDTAMAGSRFESIMGDAAHVILTQDSKKATDISFLDDEVLISNGMTIDEIHTKYNPKGVQLGMMVQDFMC